MKEGRFVGHVERNEAVGGIVFGLLLLICGTMSVVLYHSVDSSDCSSSCCC